jgi:enoyl-CoA hydratase/carnithine racemase
MGLVDYTVEEHVALITLDSGENRFNPVFLDAMLSVLDDIQTRTAATTAIVRSAHPKIFCNGIDLDWMMPLLQSRDTAALKLFFYQLNRLFKRLLTYPLVTIAAITGHVFAGGAILTCAFDFRFMRSDRGYFCLPEVDLGIPFLPGMNALLRRAIAEPVLSDMQLSGVRLTAEQCQALNIVNQACHIDDLMAVAIQYAKNINKKRDVTAEIKARLNQSVLHAIEVQDVAYIESGQYVIQTG